MSKKEKSVERKKFLLRQLKQQAMKLEQEIESEWSDFPLSKGTKSTKYKKRNSKYFRPKRGSLPDLQESMLKNS